jgi:hypothetical protein
MAQPEIFAVKFKLNSIETFEGEMAEAASFILDYSLFLEELAIGLLSIPKLEIVDVVRMQCQKLRGSSNSKGKLASAVNTAPGR